MNIIINFLITCVYVIVGFIVPIAFGILLPLHLSVVLQDAGILGFIIPALIFIIGFPVGLCWIEVFYASIREL